MSGVPSCLWFILFFNLLSGGAFFAAVATPFFSLFDCQRYSCQVGAAHPLSHPDSRPQRTPAKMKLIIFAGAEGRRASLVNGLTLKPSRTTS